MSYTVVKTVTVIREKLYESTDLTKTLGSFATSESYLVLHKLSGTYVLSLGQILNTVRNLDMSAPISTALSALLTDVFVDEFKTDSIPVKTQSDLYNKRLNVFNPVALNDYKVHFTSVNTPTILDDVSKKGYLDDLSITSEHDLSSCLVAVNGIFHRTVFLENVLYVLDGFRTIRLSGRKDILVVDTKALGGHTIVPLTPDMVTHNVYNQPAVATLPHSISGNTVLVVIDGYLYHKEHKAFSIVDETHLKIHTGKLPLIQQFRHNPKTLYKIDRYGEDSSQSSRKYTDAYEKIFLNKNIIPSTSLKTVAFQYSRLTAYHSFLIVFNNPNIYTTSIDILPTGTPQFYYDPSDRSVSGILLYGCGLCPSHVIWKDKHKRKSVFISHQDSAMDWQDLTVASSFIPTLSSDPERAAKLPAKFIDYIAA